MTDSSGPSYYKSERGRQAITNWYDALLAKFTFDHELRYVETRFGQTHLIAAGPKDGPPLILVQAIAGSAPLWYHQIPEFAQKYRVYALDTPGQPGRSDPNPPPFLEGGYSDWLLDVADSLHIERAHFAGVSSAGWYVLKLAIHAPARVDKVIMVSPTGLTRARFPIKIWLDNYVRKKKKDDRALEDDLTSRSFMPASGSPEYDRQLARAMALATRHYHIDRSIGIVDEQSGRIDRWQALKVLRTLFFPEATRTLQQLERPGLVVLGEHEMLYDSRKASARIIRLMPTVRVVVIPETGHSVMYDQPAIFNTTVLDFLAA